MKSITGVLTAFIIVSFLASCNPRGPGAFAIPAVTFDTPPLTVYMPQDENRGGGAEYASRLVNSAGFNIVFREEEFNQNFFMRKFINREDEKAVIITNQSSLNWMRPEGLIGNFYEAAEETAPGYLNLVKNTYFKDELYFMPTLFTEHIYGMAVLIKNEIFDEYGLGIRTGSEYRELLIWIMEEYERTPGITSIYSADSLRGHTLGYTALNLFLPEKGYTSLTGMFTGIGAPEFPCYLWMDENNNIRPFYKIDDAKNAILELVAWRAAGLMDFVGDDVEFSPLDYPTVLASTLQIIEMNMNRIDLSGYTVNLLDGPVWVVPPTTGAVAVPGADVSEFLRFMEWLNVKENFIYFFFGIEGVDYATDPAGAITDAKKSDYHLWRNKYIFQRSEFYGAVMLNPAGRPVNFAAETSRLTPAQPLLDAETRRSLANAVLGNSLHMKHLSDVHQYFNFFNELLFTGIRIPADYIQRVEMFFEVAAVPGFSDRMAEMVVDALSR